MVLPTLGRDRGRARCPGGAHPSYAQGYYDRDNDYYRAWDAISRDREAFTAWLDEHVLRPRRPCMTVPDGRPGPPTR